MCFSISLVFKNRIRLINALCKIFVQSADAVKMKRKCKKSEQNSNNNKTLE